MNYFLLFLVLSLGLPATQGLEEIDFLNFPEPIRVKNIDKATLGYDIIQGNPDSTNRFGGNIDPGYKQPIFRTVYDDADNMTGDGCFYKPKGINVDSISNCHLSFATDIIHGAQSYSKSLKRQVKADFSYWGASFKGSADYDFVEKQTSEYQSTFAKSAAYCEVIELTLKDYTPPPFTEQFMVGVARLKGDYDGSLPQEKNPYFKFINAFGTHAVRKMRLGGKFGVQYEIANTSWISLTQSSLNIEASASASAFGISAAGSGMSSSERELAQNFSRYTANSVTYSLGGGIPADGKEREWGLNSITDAQVVMTELMAISDLLTEDYFPDDPLIDDKHGNLSLALKDYCNQLVKAGKLSNCDSPTDPERKRDTSFGGMYQVDDCNTNNVNNPFTGDLNCPHGYTKVKFARVKCPEGNNCGGTQYYCINRTAYGGFGGAYQTRDKEGCSVGNSECYGGCCCPYLMSAYRFERVTHPEASFIPFVGYTEGSNVFICLADFVSGKSPVGAGYQLINAGDAGSTYGTVFNPFTVGPSCPSGYTARKVGRSQAPGGYEGADSFICTLT